MKSSEYKKNSRKTTDNKEYIVNGLWFYQQKKERKLFKTYKVYAYIFLALG